MTYRSASAIRFAVSATLLLLTTALVQAAGEVVWAKRLTSSGVATDRGNAVITDGSSNTIVIGESDNDAVTVKYGPGGNLLWRKTYEGLGVAQALAVALDGNGNILVVGYTGASTDVNTYNYFTAKYAPNGNLLWVKRYNGPYDNGNGEDRAVAVITDGSSNTIVTGRSLGSTANYDYYTIKYSPSGAILWQQRVHSETGGAEPCAIGVDLSGNVIVTGYYTNTLTGQDYHTIKYRASDGAVLWTKRLNGNANGSDVPSALAMDGNSVIVTGYSVTSGSDGLTNQGDFCTVKYSANGSLLWTRRVGGSSRLQDEATGVAVDGGGNVYVTGLVSVNGEQFFDINYMTVKYSSNGVLAWKRTYDGPAPDGQDIPSAIAVDGAGNPIVTGRSPDANGDVDYYTIKYDGSDGTRFWARRYSGPQGTDEGLDVTVDGNGNVLVTGASLGDGSGFDIYTLKYAP